MAEVILMPRLSDTMIEGVISKWHVQLGHPVELGTLLAEVETDKATMDLESYKEGFLLYRGAEEGEKVAVNDLLAVIGGKTEDISELVANSKRLSKKEATDLPLANAGYKEERKEAANLVTIDENTESAIGTDSQAMEIAMLIQHLGFEPGMMIGIFGKWGRGKTFLWKRIWAILRKSATQKFYAVDYRAWQYQDTPAAWAYLYERIFSCYFGAKEWWPPFHFIEPKFKVFSLNIKRKGLLPILKFLLITLVGLTSFLFARELSYKGTAAIQKLVTYLGIPIATLATLYQAFRYVKKEYSAKATALFTSYMARYTYKEELGLQAEIQKEIATLMKRWIKKKDIGRKRIVMFVDDVDRCSEHKILPIIDALRVMLDDPEMAKRIVIVTAVDERVLKMAISNKYYDLLKKDFSQSIKPKSDEAKKLVREYIDKLFIFGIKLKTLNGQERIGILKAITKNKVAGPKSGGPVLSANGAVGADDTSSSPSRISYLETIGPKGRIEIDDAEFDRLSETLSNFNADMTPRDVRIFYYRYLVAKRFLLIALSPELEKEWHRSADKRILPYLIFVYGWLKPISMLYTDQSESILKLENSTHNPIILLDQKFFVSTKLLIELLDVVGTVVAY